jgi:hypothetical protein
MAQRLVSIEPTALEQSRLSGFRLSLDGPSQLQQLIFHHFALLFRDSSVVKRAGPLIIEPVRLPVLKTVQQRAMLCFLA